MSELQKTVNVCTNLVGSLDDKSGGPLREFRDHIIKTQEQWNHDTAAKRLRDEMDSMTAAFKRK